MIEFSDTYLQEIQFIIKKNKVFIGITLVIYSCPDERQAINKYFISDIILINDPVRIGLARQKKKQLPFHIAFLVQVWSYNSKSKLGVNTLKTN